MTLARSFHLAQLQISHWQNEVRQYPGSLHPSADAILNKAALIHRCLELSWRARVKVKETASIIVTRLQDPIQYIRLKEANQVVWRSNHRRSVIGSFQKCPPKGEHLIRAASTALRRKGFESRVIFLDPTPLRTHFLPDSDAEPRGGPRRPVLRRETGWTPRAQGGDVSRARAAQLGNDAPGTSRETAARQAGGWGGATSPPAAGTGGGDAPSSCALAPGARKGGRPLRARGAEAGELRGRSAIAPETTTLPARAPRSPKDTTAPAEGKPRWPSTTRRREAARAPSMAAAGRPAAGRRLC